MKVALSDGCSGVPHEVQGMLGRGVSVPGSGGKSMRRFLSVGTRWQFLGRQVCQIVQVRDGAFHDAGLPPRNLIAESANALVAKLDPFKAK